jgi:hypothetical protein
MSTEGWLVVLGLVVVGAWVVGAVADYLITHSPVCKLTQAVRARAARLPWRLWLDRLTDTSRAMGRRIGRTRSRSPQEG